MSRLNHDQIWDEFQALMGRKEMEWALIYLSSEKFKEELLKDVEAWL